MYMLGNPVHWNPRDGVDHLKPAVVQIHSCTYGGNNHNKATYGTRITYIIVRSEGSWYFI